MNKIKIFFRRFNYRMVHEYFTLDKVILIIALIVAGFWVWGSLQMMQRNYSLQKDLDEKQQELLLAQLDTANAQLEQKYYQTDEYKELAVRQNLGLVTPGESVLILPDNSDAVEKESATETTTSIYAKSSVTDDHKSNFTQWINFLFGANR